MAKRKRNTAPYQQVWHEDDVVQLVAWLNHTIQHEIDFNDTVVQHLQKSRNKSVSLTQVNSKLSALWNSYGSNDLPDKKWKELFNQGSSILTRLRGDVIAAIERASRELEENFIPQERRTRSTRLVASAVAKPQPISTIPTDDIDTNIGIRPQSSVKPRDPTTSSYCVLLQSSSIYSVCKHLPFDAHDTNMCSDLNWF